MAKTSATATVNARWKGGEVYTSKYFGYYNGYIVLQYKIHTPSVPIYKFRFSVGDKNNNRIQGNNSYSGLGETSAKYFKVYVGTGYTTEAYWPIYGGPTGPVTGPVYSYGNNSAPNIKIGISTNALDQRYINPTEQTAGTETLLKRYTNGSVTYSREYKSFSQWHISPTVSGFFRWTDQVSATKFYYKTEIEVAGELQTDTDYYIYVWQKDTTNRRLTWPDSCIATVDFYSVQVPPTVRIKDASTHEFKGYVPYVNIATETTPGTSYTPNPIWVPGELYIYKDGNWVKGR